MVRAAKRLARCIVRSRTFNRGGLDSLLGQQADVVSTASLLAVLDDKSAGLTVFWNCVRPGGHLPLIEPTSAMSPANTKQLIDAGSLPRKHSMLSYWTVW